MTPSSRRAPVKAKPAWLMPVAIGAGGLLMVVLGAILAIVIFGK